MKRQASYARQEIDRLRNGEWRRVPDCIAVEEPLEIQIDHESGGRRISTAIGVTMRTPGHDFELAAGFLSGEGIVTNRDDIIDISYRTDVADEAERENTVQVTLRRGLALDVERQKRNFTITSACGVCGKASLDALVSDGCRPLRSGARISAEVLTSLPARLRASQRGFDATGGLHACGLFTADGTLVSLREDVGRHNAFDKLVGEQFLAGNMQQVQEMAVLLSGRASYELLQKALRARIPIVAAVGAPSSLAVEIAESFGMTLAGFVKDGGFNVYAGRERICE